MQVEGSLTPVRRSIRKPRIVLLERASPTSLSPSHERQVARLAALQAELKHMGEAKLASRIPDLSEFRRPATRRAPFSFVKRKAARYRMPRRVKQQLIDSFVQDSRQVGAQPRVAIVGAHQDDETVGAGARLSKMSDAWIVHVTDGAPRDPSVALRYGFDRREDYATARQEEVMKALALAGVPSERVICLNYVDGEAALCMVDLVLRIADLLDNIDPDIVITHPYEGGHTDHDATAFAVHMACGLLRREGIDPPAVLEMTSYYKRDGRRVVHEFLPHERADRALREVELSEADQQLKQRMYDSFTTQQRILTTFSTEIEKFRPAPRYVFTQPPHDGELNYERFGDPHRGERWRRDAKEALAKLRMRNS